MKQGARGWKERMVASSTSTHVFMGGSSSFRFRRENDPEAQKQRLVE